MNIPAQISRTRAEWAADIRAAHTEVVEAFLELGQKLLAAKQELAHGEFLQMIENDLPFTSSTAQRLMKIASNREQANAARAQLLPAKWTVAYELTKLPEGTLKTAVATGTIHPEMSREDAAALRPAVPEHAKTSGIVPVRETTALEVMSGILGSPRHWMRTFQRNGVSNKRAPSRRLEPQTTGCSLRARPRTGGQTRGQDQCHQG
jgi:hypothetical protein